MSNKLSNKLCKHPGCQRHIQKDSITEMCYIHYLQTGSAKRGRTSTVKTTCWNKHCRAIFRCPPEKDPRYALCPKCCRVADEMRTMARFTPAAKWLR